MKQLLYKVSALVLLTGAFWACRDREQVEPEDTNEYRFVRLLVSDEASSQLSLIDPREMTIKTFPTKFPKSSVYASESGRVGVMIHRENHLVETFDLGIESHGDHADVKGEPKMGTLLSEGKLPTHFKSDQGEIQLFNDGDGTLSIAKEKEVTMAGQKFRQIQTGIAAHHGAMAMFSNGTYAITEKDGTVAGTLPERVRIIDNTGKVVQASKVATKGIHGNATDGKYAVFGSASGILVVEENGTQKLIQHPANFGTAWFGTIYETREAGRFVGYTAAMGAYLIDVTKETITPIVENKDIMQCKVDYAKLNLVTLLHSGEVQVYDLRTNTLKKSGKLIDVVAKDEKQKPTLEATQKYLYVVMPKSGEVLKAEVANLSNAQRIKVSGTPYRIAVMGAEVNVKGDD